MIHILQSEFKTLDWIPNWFYFKMALMRNDYQNLNVTAKLSIVLMKTLKKYVQYHYINPR